MYSTQPYSAIYYTQPNLTPLSTIPNPSQPYSTIYFPTLLRYLVLTTQLLTPQPSKPNKKGQTQPYSAIFHTHWTLLIDLLYTEP